MSSDLFVIDTCSLTWAMRTAYPLDVVPRFWQLLEEEIVRGRVISNELVKAEIEFQDDDLSRWFLERQQIFHLVDQSLMDEVDNTIKKYPKMVSLGEKDRADPFLIAQARLNGGAVVTQEQRDTGRKKLKIPDVCDMEKIVCINTLEMMRRLAWRI